MKWHYTTVHFESLRHFGLTITEYILSDIVYHQSYAGSEWWAYSPNAIAEVLCVDERTIRRAAISCEEKGTLKKESDKLISSQEFIDVVYPRNGHNYRLDGQNTRDQTDKNSVYLNIIGKKNNTALEDSQRPQIVETREASDLDGVSGDSKSPRLSPDKRKAYDELIAWSENERGFEFPKTSRLKQYRAFKLANENKIPRDHLIERWEDMSSDKFWQKVGFDWMNVVQELLKKPV